MISSTSDNQAERDASDNLTLAPQAFDAIIAAKQAVEEQCTRIVSCADIIALAARDVVVFAGGKTWDVPLGRRDGLVSQASQVSGRLPQASFNVGQLCAKNYVGQLAKNFSAAGLSVADMVVLSGGHTIGVSHCNQFSNRLYAFSSSHKTDPSMDPTYVQSLEQTCLRTGGDPFATSSLDPRAFDKFDNVYYQNLQKGQGLLFSDEVLFRDGSTRDLVNELAASESLFLSRFKDSMIKRGREGRQGLHHLKKQGDP